MTVRPSVIERAFEMARSGKFFSKKEIADALKREHFEAVDGHLQGRSTSATLKKLMAESRAG